MKRTAKARSSKSSTRAPSVWSVPQRSHASSSSATEPLGCEPDSFRVLKFAQAARQARGAIRSSAALGPQVPAA
jgi:hypothetical protein